MLFYSGSIGMLVRRTGSGHRILVVISFKMHSGIEVASMRRSSECVRILTLTPDPRDEHGESLGAQPKHVCSCAWGADSPPSKAEVPEFLDPGSLFVRVPTARAGLAAAVP